MIVNYLWNTALSEALYPSLQGLEVTLRKSLHGALSRRYGTPAWYDYPECLELLEQQKIIEAKIEIPNRKGRTGITLGRVVAQLSFGFWPRLLNNPYEPHLWSPDRYAMIRAVFPNIARYMRSRGTIFKRYDGMRQLRNRVLHFEPI
jgi:hypothetical protein